MMSIESEVSDEKSRPLSLGQKRSNHAWKVVSVAIRNFARDEAALKEYAGEARKLPIRIKASGLGQALAFINAKSKKSKRSLEQLHKDLSQWILVDRGMLWHPGDPDWKPQTSNAAVPSPNRADQREPHPDLLLEAIVFGTSDFLRWATDETLAYLQWLNRFLEAKVEVDENPED